MDRKKIHTYKRSVTPMRKRNPRWGTLTTGGSSDRGRQKKKIRRAGRHDIGQVIKGVNRIKENRGEVLPDM